MYSGMVLYNTEDIGSETACELGEKLFTDLGIPITGAGYYKILKNGDHPGDHDIIEISFPDLKKKIKNNEITAFRIYSEKRDVQPWYASFGYMTNEFGGFHYIDAQYPSVVDEPKATIEFLRTLSNKISYSYGVKYDSDKITKAFYYATGDNMVNIYQYEDASLFRKECSGRFKGQERYKSTMLRMVYPVNVINRHHLDIVISNINLKEWISSDEKHGVLEELSSGLWLWTVDAAELDEVNKYLGNAGVLISWKPLTIKKTQRKLP
ncbi:hypothetical protein [Entomohabitans teleogrylli]|uniref:hypothetical protein n=1 Tax=Entomohabitans teleogrylli TaxID=1384589 RepID=UPI00073DAFC9|nr:hypothetical protein [Entomohabitans teleogrylli]